jgi:hypothetical protein
MQEDPMRQAKPFQLPLVALGEWLLVLPASMFLAAAGLRLLQPRQYQPARLSWILFEWTTEHISRVGAAILFIGLPLIVLIVGCATLFRVWREDQTLRNDVMLALTIVRRRLAIALLTTAPLLAAAILLFAVVHVFTD